MSTINTILIKRRLADSVLNSLPVLSGGELAFSEKNNTLYYGATGGSLAIGGDGAFVSRTLNQNILGDKVFLGSTTLSSTTFSTNSLIDVGGNLLTNVAYPSANNDAASKVYVDDLAANISGNFVDRTTAQTISGVKTFFDNATFQKYIDVTDYVSTSAYKIDSTVVIDNDKNAYFANIGASGNLTVTGNLSVLGTQTVINTETINISGISTQIDIINDGTGTGITVNQTGNRDVAEFKDDGATAFIIKDGGNVGVGTATPNEKLTVSGNISADGNIYATGNLFVDGGGVNTTLYVEDGKVGINTETPNEALTVVGNISASQNVFAVNGDFTGTVDADGAATLGSTLDVTGAATFASSVSAAGALTVDGTTTLNDDLTVTDVITVNSASNANNITIDGTNHMITITDNVNAGIPLTDYKLTGITATGNGFTLDTTNDGGAGINFTPAAGSHTNVTQGNLNVLTGDLSGNGSNFIRDFIIDGGSF